MKERLIITLPINPYDKMSVGKMSTPILGESLAKSLGGKFVMSINLLSSYEQRNSQAFYKLMKQYNINPDYYWVDKEHINELIEKIYFLINSYYIEENENEILSCECGKIEIPVDNLKSINYNNSLIEFYNNKYYCKICKKECKKNIQQVLSFKSNLVNKTNIKFYPQFINKEKITFNKTVGTNNIVISRKRNTGVIIELNNHQYNLDIDFLWQVYLSLFKNEEKIVMCSNRQLYQLYMVGMLELTFKNNKNTIFLATPYLEYSQKQEELEERIISLKIFTLLVMKWSKKDNLFDESLLKYINTMNVEKKQMLYNLLIEEIESKSEIIEDLNIILSKKYNFQNANKELKRRRNV